MKFVFMLLILCCIASSGYAQFDIFNKAKEKIEKKAEEKIDEALNKDKKKEEPAPVKNETAPAPESTSSSPAEKNAETSPLKSYSRFDFIPGDKILFYDDFSSDNIGDFPQKWNTNGSGEVVTVNNYPGRWLKIKNSSTYLPYFDTKKYGQNYTIEFDLIADVDAKTNPGSIYFDLYKTDNLDKVPQSSSGPYAPGAFFSVYFSHSGGSQYNIRNAKMEKGGVTAGGINNNVKDDAFIIGKLNRISIAVNQQRYRLYVNDKKVFDLPRLMAADDSANAISIRTWGWNEAKDYQVLIGNFRIAEGASAPQSKLITDGRFVTHGILFDSGSDKIKPESYGTLKEIAAALKDNASVKVKIIGHTDSDGDDKTNLDLSERRATAVKAALAQEFSIEAARLETSGKGESEPVAGNDTPEGKATNRRVEFVKL